MEIIISVQVQLAEAYNIIIDNEKATKVRGNKKTTIKLSNEQHTLQIKSLNGKSSIIKIDKPNSSNDNLELNFETNWIKVFKEGYYELEMNK